MSDKKPSEADNPGQEEAEEKVKQMLDPSIPDAPATKKIETQTPEENPEIVAVSAPVASSAPELPADTDAAETKSKKRTIAITHHGEEIQKTPDEPEEAGPVKQITIADHSDSASDLAHQLDKTIAELDDEHKKDEVLTNENKPITANASGTEEQEAELTELLDAAGKVADDTPPHSEDEEEIEVEDPKVVTDAATDKAVAEIVAAEADVVLEVEDAVRDTDIPAEKTTKPKKRGRLRHFLKSTGFRRTLTVVLVFAFLAAGFWPTSRYAVLNTIGVRASSSMVILDESSGQPLKNVHVSLGGSSGTTDEEGKLRLQNIRLGSQNLTLEKQAFANLQKTIVIGWGSNPLGELKLRPTGTQYIFRVTDFLSGKPLSKLEATYHEASAKSDEKGIIKLALEKPGDEPFTVSIKGDGLRTEEVRVDPHDTAERDVRFVPVQKHLFISKRAGTYDVYSIYADGQDEKRLLEGNGFERSDITLVQHPSDNIAAYVSTRGNQHDNKGNLLSNLLILDTDTGGTTNITTALEVKVIDWSGDNVVYVQVAADAEDSPTRYTLVSYNYKTDTKKDIVSSNYFNDVVAMNHVIYYAPSSAHDSKDNGLFRVNADGSGKQTLFDQEVWNIIRTDYEHLTLSVEQKWYDYQAGNAAPVKLNAAPADQTPRIYSNAQDGAHSVRIENRDGKGTILVYDTQTKSETSLTAAAGITYPLYWLNNTVLVYRLESSQETADYAISINGGDAFKIRDVTASHGLDQAAH